MAIIFDKEKQTFTLHTDHSTYQMQVVRGGFLLHLYYGERTPGTMDYLLSFQDRGFSGNPYDAGTDRTFSLDALPQEFPTLGTGDYRSTALIVENRDGSLSCDLRYQGYEILPGKYGLEGLPALYGEEGEAETLKIFMKDAVTQVAVTLLYGVFPKHDLITRAAVVVNEGQEKICLKKAASACLDFLWGSYDAITFYGRHAMERNFQQTPVAHGNFVIGSRRGTSSHQYSPSVILAEKECSEDWGSCYGMTFVYSGGFQAEAELDQYGQTRAVMGLQPEQFSYSLAAGESFQVPETAMSYSGRGLSGLSKNFHRGFRSHLCRGRYRDQVRPVLVNSWEASYLDFTGESLLKLAAQAKELGIEMLVLDDGWFGDRDSDDRALGDWVVNEDKLGCTMGELAEKVKSLGLKFGLWIEPECVSENSRLYREHPDWAFAIPGRNPVRGRYQLMLDFSREEAADYVFDQIAEVLDHADIRYVKWDMNRSLADVFSQAGKEQGKVLYDYVKGLYRFLDRLLLRYPDLLLEGCSGGGGRFDAGMLYYTPQIWCSDNTDAIDRLRIQYGTSFFFPIQTVGSHVSAVPNHQTGRVTPMYTRGTVAMAGTFGYELDLGKLTEEEKEEIRGQIAWYHRHGRLIQTGDYYRLSNPFEDEAGAWAFVSEDKREVLIQAVATEMHGNMTPIYLRLKGLSEEKQYVDQESGRIYGGGALMQTGILFPAGLGEYQALQLYLTAVEEA